MFKAGQFLLAREQLVYVCVKMCLGYISAMLFFTLRYQTFQVFKKYLVTSRRKILKTK